MLMRKDAVLIKDGVFTWTKRKYGNGKRVSSPRRSEDTLFLLICDGSDPRLIHFFHFYRFQMVEGGGEVVIQMDSGFAEDAIHFDPW